MQYFAKFQTRLGNLRISQDVRMMYNTVVLTKYEHPVNLLNNNSPYRIHLCDWSDLLPMFLFHCHISYLPGVLFWVKTCKICVILGHNEFVESWKIEHGESNKRKCQINKENSLLNPERGIAKSLVLFYPLSPVWKTDNFGWIRQRKCSSFFWTIGFYSDHPNLKRTYQVLISEMKKFFCLVFRKNWFIEIYILIMGVNCRLRPLMFMSALCKTISTIT